MNKNDFLFTLRFELEKRKVEDIDEIISDFEDHFNSHLEEGKTEAEIARKIGNPIDIARDYESQFRPRTKANNTIIRLGLLPLDFGAAILAIILAGSLVVIGAFSLAALGLGVLLVLDVNLLGLIPQIPYVPGLIFGLASISLAIVSFISTMYIYLYIKHWIRVYLRKRKNILNNNIYPSLGRNPRLSKKLAANLKFINILATITFISTLTIGYIVSSIIARAFEFWHVWNWFV